MGVSTKSNGCALSHTRTKRTVSRIKRVTNARLFRYNPRRIDNMITRRIPPFRRSYLSRPDNRLQGRDPLSARAREGLRHRSQAHWRLGRLGGRTSGRAARDHRRSHERRARVHRHYDQPNPRRDRCKGPRVFRQASEGKVDSLQFTVDSFRRGVIWTAVGLTPLWIAPELSSSTHASSSS